VNRPTIYPHWTAEPELATADVACGLLDQGQSPLILLPPGSSAALAELFPSGHAQVSEGLAARTRDNIFRAWLIGSHPVLLSEVVPPLELGHGLWSSLHVLVPFLADDWRTHAPFLKALAAPGRPPVRLHLFLNPTAPELNHSHIKALIPANAARPWEAPAAPDIATIFHKFQMSVARFGEHHPAIVSTQPPVNRNDVEEAVRAIDLRSPTSLQISTERLRNQARARRRGGNS